MSNVSYSSFPGSGRLSDHRIATTTFFVVAGGICLQELLKTTASTFQKKYSLYRFICYCILFFHCLFGIMCALYVANSMYGIESFVFLVLSCMANFFYQILSLNLLVMKLATFALNNRALAVFQKMVVAAMVMKGLLSTVSLIVKFYMVAQYDSLLTFYRVGMYQRTTQASSWLNLAGIPILISDEVYRN